jgi:hypothetical protein
VSTGTPPGEGLVEIRLLHLSLDAYRHAAEHHDELLREFALIQSREPSEGHTVPRRLLGLIEALTTEYGAMTAMPRADIDAAIERGDDSVDLTYVLPVSIGPAIVHLVDLLRETDEYCRHGDLLTLAPPPDAVAFREWFLLEFVNQVHGRPPTPWPQFLASSRRP